MLRFEQFCIMEDIDMESESAWKEYADYCESYNEELACEQSGGIR